MAIHMNKYFPMFLLFLTGCANGKVESPFITVNYLGCMKINKLYYKDQIKEIDSFYLNDEECSINYPRVRLKKDLIVAFGERASIVLEKMDEGSDDPRAPLQVSAINKMHCLIQLQSGKMRDISMTCNDLEKELYK